MNEAIFQVDAFSDAPFSGNPAAVCLLASPRDKDWMQKVATEMNLSETAFYWQEKGNHYLKWFTPEKEVWLCGHATLATTWVLYEQGLLTENQEITFKTQAHKLISKVSERSVFMNFPALPTVSDDIPEFPDLEIRSFEKNVNGYCILEVEEEKALLNYLPDYGQLLSFGEALLIFTALSHKKGIDFTSRVFAPAFGIREDPVTGSAHCALAPFWSKKLKKNQLTGFQASNRGGFVYVTYHGEYVVLKGQAVTVLEGTLLH